jgi:hypothetical protein
MDTSEAAVWCEGGRARPVAWVLGMQPMLRRLLQMPVGAHIESMRGDFKSHTVYCSKEGQLIEHGQPPRQGERTDLTDEHRRWNFFSLFFFTSSALAAHAALPFLSGTGFFFITYFPRPSSLFIRL